MYAFRKSITIMVITFSNRTMQSKNRKSCNGEDPNHWFSCWLSLLKQEELDNVILELNSKIQKEISASFSY